jgi:methylthioribose-1-phosphate isomerase
MSGELLAIAQHCAAMGKDCAIIATETRPYVQGARLTASELARGGVRVSLIPDCAVAQVMARSEVNAIIVGSDRSAQNGDIINKIGTYPLAVMARRYGIHFTFWFKIRVPWFKGAMCRSKRGRAQSC